MQRKLAHLELTFRGKSDKPPPAKFGTYLGRGDGMISGSSINGAVTWDLFEVQGKTVCDAHLVGMITTDHGARIELELLGFFTRSKNMAKWRLASSFRFRTSNPDYLSLNTVVGWVDGYFDESTYTHAYDLMVPGW